MNNNHILNSDVSLDNSSVSMKYKIVFIGDVAVGKTSIITRIAENKFRDSYEPSIGVDFLSRSVKYKEKLIKLQLWDTAGQEKYKSLIPSYIRGAAIIFIVYDITSEPYNLDKSSFDNVAKWLNFITTYVKQAEVIVVGNKIDTESSRVVFNSKVEQFAEERGLRDYQVSAKEGTNALRMFFSALAALPCLRDEEGDVVGLLGNAINSRK